jgi:hypothetical protein
VATLSELQQRLETLRERRASAVAETEYDGRRVAYRSDAQLAAAIADLERQIAALTTPPVTTVRVAASKGLET